jgi:glycogen synthase
VRVLLSADTVGGVRDFAVTLATGLTERGHDVLVAGLGPDAVFEGLPASVEVVERDFRLEWMPGAEPDLRPAAEWLAATARGWGAEIAHLNQMAYPAFGLGIPTLVVAHSDVLSWFSETTGSEAGAEWDGYARIVGAGLSAASLVVAPSEYQAALLRRGFGSVEVHVVHNGSAVPPAPDPARARERLVLSAGRAWDAAKGMDLLDGAMLALGTTAPPARHFGATDGPNGESFTARRIRCAGVVDGGTLGAWMDRAALYVAPSRYEPFGLAPLEAALRGCPLVLSDIGSFRELWDGCATFFRSGSSASLAEALEEALASTARTDEFARAARARAVDRYSADRMVEDYLALYRALLGSPFVPVAAPDR